MMKEVTDARQGFSTVFFLFFHLAAKGVWQESDEKSDRSVKKSDDNKKSDRAPTLKTLTSLNKEVMPFFPKRQ